MRGWQAGCSVEEGRGAVRAKINSASLEKDVEMGVAHIYIVHMDNGAAARSGETKMAKWQIYSKAGVDMGEWEGETKDHALAAMHREASYVVDVIDDELCFAECGRVENWDFDAVSS